MKYTNVIVWIVVTGYQFNKELSAMNLHTHTHTKRISNKRDCMLYTLWTLLIRFHSSEFNSNIFMNYSNQCGSNANYIFCQLRSSEEYSKASWGKAPICLRSNQTTSSTLTLRLFLFPMATTSSLRKVNIGDCPHDLSRPSPSTYLKLDSIQNLKPRLIFPKKTFERFFSIAILGTVIWIFWHRWRCSST